MTAISPFGPASSTEGTPPQAVRIPETLRIGACERLVSGPDRRKAAQNLMRSANSHGIDLDLMWGVLAPADDSKSPRVLQTCLAVLGSGRTAMLFHSSPEQPKVFGARARQCEEIGACLRRALEELSLIPERAALAQCLIEPRHKWAPEVCTGAGMISVGELAYMRKPIGPGVSIPPEPDWGEGIVVRPIRSLDRTSAVSDYEHLARALESSYEGTLDCPELCGLRSIHDIIESHMATGSFDVGNWLLIFRDDQPVGCCLLTHCPTSASVELVYLGLGPRGRGMGLGKRVLAYGIERVRHLPVHEVTCAVDTRNAPAISVYASLGFSCFDSRIGFVAPLPLGS